MAPTEIAAFLAQRSRMQVATLGPAGFPHLVAVDYVLVDGVPAFVSYGRAQKVANLRRDPRLACLVEEGAAYHELRGVELEASARIVSDFDHVLALSRAVVCAATGRTDLPDFLAGELERITPHRVAVHLDLVRTRSWDHTRLGGSW
jgi:hypothetical protein